MMKMACGIAELLFTTRETIYIKSLNRHFLEIELKFTDLKKIDYGIFPKWQKPTTLGKL